MEYAVIRTGGKQYRVKRGDILEVDKLPAEKDSTVTFQDVLLFVSDGVGLPAGRQVKIGTPTLSDVKVKAKVLDQIKGEKIHVRKFKAKARYRRHVGFRPLLTRVQIEKIESGKAERPIRGSTPKTEASSVIKNPKNAAAQRNLDDPF